MNHEEAKPEESLDEQVFVALRTRWHSRPLEVIITTFSRLGNWGLFWLGFSLFLWFIGLNLGRGMFVFLIPVVYATLLANFIIKQIIKKERPVSDDPALKPLVGVPGSYSSPSSHAAMSYAAAIGMTFYYAPLWAIFFGLATLMAWSRVYVGVHYPSDVIAGTFVGLISGTVMVMLLIVV